MEIVSYAQSGYQGEIVKVEADLRRGIPAVDIVGLPDGAVREARERMRAAIRNSGLPFPRDRVLINLSPAALKKEGGAFDLPIALAVLGESEGILTSDNPLSVLVLGELELSGVIRPVSLTLAAVSLALEKGVRHCIIPRANLAEAEHCPTHNTHVALIGVDTLTEAFHRLAALCKGEEYGAAKADHTRPMEAPCTWEPVEEGYEEVKGQALLVRSLTIAAAGGHNLIAWGSPGSGKTLALRRFPALLPLLDTERALEVTRIYGLAGISAGEQGLITRAPFREPHQGASLEGMTGGGVRLKPGEVSLAHGGALFLDEAAQFKGSVLQSLRGPLETGWVTVSRAGKTERYPARFQLLLTMNPCPCGNFGSMNKPCLCAPEAVDRYWKRLSAPLLDRMDIRVAVTNPGQSMAGEEGENTELLRARIAVARLRQWRRNRRYSHYWLNAHLQASHIDEVCKMESQAQKVYRAAVGKGDLSGRGAHAVCKVARTIADMADKDLIGEAELQEALSLHAWGEAAPIFLYA